MTSEDSERLEGVNESSDKSSGERSDPRESENPERPTGASGFSEESSGSSGDARDAIPLNIAGHETEKRRREREAAEASGEADDGDNASTADREDLEAVLPETDAEDADGDDEEVEPVELLVNLAERGEIDPWDIDVVTVTDKFLDALDDVDLRTSGRALFYASVLIRMKGDELLTEDDPEEDELEPWEMALEGGDAMDPGFDPVASLEREMERRLKRKHARGKPETLDELVRELREAERGSWWKSRRQYDTSGSPSGFARGTQTLDYHTADDLRMDDEPTEGDVTGTAHMEHIESVIDDVRAELLGHYDAGRAEVLFAEIADAGGSRIQTFLALLFLAHRGQVRLQQDDLFGDLWVQDPNAATESGEVAAD